MHEEKKGFIKKIFYAGVLKIQQRKQAQQKREILSLLNYS